MVVSHGTFLAWYVRDVDTLQSSSPRLLEYPHWDLKPELKRYYLMQAAYWCQQFIVLALRLEKPRKDYYELIAHHFVTLWLVGSVCRFVLGIRSQSDRSNRADGAT